jgi:anti-sigma factor RsiW
VFDAEGEIMKNLSCVNPGALEDWELAAYAEGEANAKVGAHLEVCPACRTQLSSYRALAGNLAQRLYRSNCPSTELLREYAWKFLPQDQNKSIESHLEDCPHCQSEIGELRQALADEKPESSTGWLEKAARAAEKARLIVANLLAPPLQPQLLPSLRGEGHEALLFEAGDDVLSLNLERDQKGGYFLRGQLLAFKPIPFLEANAFLAGAEENPMTIQASLDENGSFSMANVMPGVYRLTIHWSDKRIVVPVLALKSEL